MHYRRTAAPLYEEAELATVAFNTTNERVDKFLAEKLSVGFGSRVVPLEVRIIPTKSVLH
jgi:hypothetical protein